MIIFRRIIKPITDELTTFISNIIYNKVKSTHNTTIIIVSVYFVIIGIGYVLIWRRIEFPVVDSIQKSKHMVLLLPKKLLVELDSLHKASKINTKQNVNEA